MSDDQPQPQPLPIPVQVASSMAHLKTVSAQLNSASDALAKSVARLDQALHQLNLGIPAWVAVHEWEDETGDWIRHDVGYARVASKWGIALRILEGNINQETCTRDEQWLFADGPRDLRVAAVEKLPLLLQALAKRAMETTERIKAKTAFAAQVAQGATAPVALPPRVARPVAPRPANAPDEK